MSFEWMMTSFRSGRAERSTGTSASVPETKPREKYVLNLWMDWNLTLDSAGGPNYAGNYCDAPILCDPAAGVFAKRLTYSYLEHFCRFILPGSRRIGLSCYTERLLCTAWLKAGRGHRGSRDESL